MSLSNKTLQDIFNISMDNNQEALIAKLQQLRDSQRRMALSGNRENFLIFEQSSYNIISKMTDDEKELAQMMGLI